MIVVRAPMRISFVGGGTDLPDFYTRYPGRVISTAIDKFVYVVINRTPLIDKISARYSISETVNRPSELRHTRIRAALQDLGIEKGLEIASFASLPAKTGLGSSSSFSVALMKGLHAYLGNKLDKAEAAEAASRLEIELVGEPIGKQDQYAAAFGGFNVFQFNPDHSVTVEPVLMDYKKIAELEERLLLFFTGLTRPAASVLTEQKARIGDKVDTLKEMSESVKEVDNLRSVKQLRLLPGAKRFLDLEPKPVWMVEIALFEHQPRGQGANENFLRTFELFWEHGYEAHGVVDGEMKLLSRKEIKENPLAVKSNLSSSNFIFIHAKS